MTATQTGWAQGSDAGDLALLFREMAAHYRQPDLPRAEAEKAAATWLERQSPHEPHFAIARIGGEPAGLACVALAHPGENLGRVLFLKDLFVREGHRGQAVGRALLGFLAAWCGEKNIGRIDLTTERWNEGALRFYDTLGAERHDQKIFLRFSGDALASLAAFRG